VINLITLLWTDGERHIPVDYRIYNKVVDGLTKNDHFRAMLRSAGSGRKLSCLIAGTQALKISSLSGRLTGCG
jgi:hypothetical protein